MNITGGCLLPKGGVECRSLIKTRIICWVAEGGRRWLKESHRFNIRGGADENVSLEVVANWE